MNNTAFTSSLPLSTEIMGAVSKLGLIEIEIRRQPQYSREHLTRVQQALDTLLALYPDLLAAERAFADVEEADV